MRKLILPILAMLFALAATVNAQTYQASATPQAPFSCGPTPIYCYGVPFYLNGDPTQPVSKPWIDVNPTLGTGFIAFAADGDQGLLAQYGTVSVDANSMTTTYASFTSNGRTVMAISAMSFTFGGNLGTFAATFGHYYASGSGRGGGGSGWKTTLTGGTIVINQPSGAASADSLTLNPYALSPILPADTGSGPPPSACPSGVYYASQPCGPAYQCGQNHYCQCWKAYCEVSQEYGIYQWVYWQRQW